MSENKTMELFAEGLRSCMQDRLAPEAITFLDMLTDDAVMEFPYSPPGMVRRLEGKSAIQSHVESLGHRIQIQSFAQPVIHETPTGYVLEMSCEGFAPQTGKPYNQDYISVITLRDGHIAHYRDYWNPLVVLEAFTPSQPTEQERN